MLISSRVEPNFACTSLTDMDMDNDAKWILGSDPMDLNLGSQMHVGFAVRSMLALLPGNIPEL